MACDAVTGTETHGWQGCGSWCRSTTRSSRLTWPAGSRWSWCATRTPRCWLARPSAAGAWDLGIALDWAVQRAAAKGWAAVTGRVSRPGIGGECWAARRGPERAVRVRATDGHLMGPPRRGPHLREDRRQGGDADRLLHPRTSTRPGDSCDTWVPAESGSSSWPAPRSSKCATCSSVSGRPPWTRRTGRSGPRRGPRRCGWSWIETAATSPAPAG
jgi:hypothetical protein